MNKKQILQELHNTANQLEKQGLYAEANVLTNVMTRLAQQTGQSNLNTLYNNFQQPNQAQQQPQPPQQPGQQPNQPNQAPQQPGQQAGRQLTNQDYNKLDKLYNEFNGYRDKYSLLSDDSHNKIMSGKLLQETNNVPNASIMMKKILDYMINLDNQINAIHKIDGIDARDQRYMNSSKGMFDSCKANIDTLTQLHQRLKSSGKGIPQQPK
jgi:hypothetical protein